MLLVLYAKIVDDKDIGIIMVGIYFGGLADSESEADEIARKCVSATQGGTAIPKIGPLANNDLMATIKHMIIVFDRLADRMYENERTVAKDGL